MSTGSPPGSPRPYNAVRKWVWLGGTPGAARPGAQRGRDMPQRQVIANVARLHEYMDRHRLAVVVARSGQNFTYLSGLAYPGTLARHLDLPDSVRGVRLVWPRHGEPVIVLNPIAEGLTRRDSWV